MTVPPPQVPPSWDPERDDTLVCVGVRQETHDVRTFLFAPAEPRLFHFLPGQFMTFDLPLDTGTVSRCYTIASAPTRPHRVAITVKRTGPATGWLHDRLRPGMRLRAAGPMGDFTCAVLPAQNRA
jgi:glycine betaine catabolism B